MLLASMRRSWNRTNVPFKEVKLEAGHGKAMDATKRRGVPPTRIVIAGCILVIDNLDDAVVPATSAVGNVGDRCTANLAESVGWAEGRVVDE
jgi:hypothetical protein